MNCVNCNKDVPEDKMQLAMQVLLCPPCSKGLMQLRSKLRGEVEGLLARLDTSLRFRVTQGGLQFDKLLDRSDLLHGVARMDGAAREAACRNKTIPSSKSTKPAAITAGTKRSSSRPSAAD